MRWNCYILFPKYHCSCLYDFHSIMCNLWQGLCNICRGVWANWKKATGDTSWKSECSCPFCKLDKAYYLTLLFIPCTFLFLAPAHFCFYITKNVILCLLCEFLVPTTAYWLILIMSFKMQPLQTAGDIGGIAASLVRVPTEVCNFISYYSR